MAGMRSVPRLPLYGAAAAGVLMVLSMPPSSAGLLAWISLTPLILASQRARSGWTALVGGFVCGLVFFSGCIYWCALVAREYGGLSWPTAILVTALLVAYLSLFPALFAWLVRRASREWPVMWLGLVPLLWTATEYLRATLFTGFPWCLLGYSQQPLLPVVQVASLGGIYAVSALVATGAVLAVAVSQRRLGWGCAAVALIAGAIVWGRHEVSRFPEAGRTIRVGLVQPCAPPIIQGVEEAEGAMDRHILLTRRLGGVDLVVWPENSLLRDVSRFAYFRDNVGDAARRVRSPILVNSIEDDGFQVYNSAILVTPRNPSYPRYDKMHLVPFGEYVPIRRVLFFAGKMLREVSDFSPGRRRVLFSAAGARFATAICYEVIYPAEVAAFVRDSAEFLVTQSNDGWYGNTVMPYQHQAMATVRAIENRRYLIRATNSGISSIVDPGGRIIAISGIDDPTTLVADIRPSSQLSLYTRHGDVFAIVCLIAAGLTIVRPVWVALKRERVEAEPSHIVTGGSG